MNAEELLELSQDSSRRGQISNASIVYHDENPVCGDSITVYVKTEKELIQECSYECTGCVISQASACLVAEEVIGKKLLSASKMTTDDVKALLSIELGPVRTKCAMLIVAAIKKGIFEYQKKRTSKNDTTRKKIGKTTGKKMGGEEL